MVVKFHETKPSGICHLSYITSATSQYIPQLIMSKLKNRFTILIIIHIHDIYKSVIFFNKTFIGTRVYSNEITLILLNGKFVQSV